MISFRSLSQGVTIHQCLDAYPDPTVDDDEAETDPVRMGQTRHRPAARLGQSGHGGVRAARYQSNTNPPPSLPRSASEKYLNSNRRASAAAKPTTTVTGLPQGGAVPKPKSGNTSTHQENFMNIFFLTNTFQNNSVRTFLKFDIL